MTARGEMTMEQPSADTLKVMLSGQWKLGGELPKADQVQAKTPRQVGNSEGGFRYPAIGLLGHRLVDLPE